MKRIVFWLLFVWLGHDTLAVQARDVPGSAPATATRLFYLQRSKDANTVIYQANVQADQKLSPQKPVDVYWMRYAEQGQREELSAIQWQLAFGYQHRPCTDKPDTYELRLNAYPKRPLHVVHYQGKTVAMMVISGRNVCLQKVFVQLASSFHLVPKVAHIDLYGVDPDSGQAVHERIPI